MAMNPEEAKDACGHILERQVRENHIALTALEASVNARIDLLRGEIRDTLCRCDIALQRVVTDTDAAKTAIDQVLVTSGEQRHALATITTTQSRFWPKEAARYVMAALVALAVSGLTSFTVTSHATAEARESAKALEAHTAKLQMMVRSLQTSAGRAPASMPVPGSAP